MSVRFLKSTDTPSVIKIWRECFTNDLDYINSFIYNCLPYTKTLVVTAPGSDEAVSILTLIPTYTKVNGKNIKGGYIYGVGTLIKHRGHSYSKLLMKAIIESSIQENLDYLLVKPASDSLYTLYQGMSFDHILNKIEIGYNIIQVNSHPNLLANSKDYHYYSSFSQTLATTLYKIRDASLSETTFLLPQNNLSYSLKENFSRSGFVCLNPDDGLFCIGYPNKSKNGETTAIITDHNLKSENEFLSYSKLILNEGLYESILFDAPENLNSSNKLAKKSALLKILTPQQETINKIKHYHLPLTME